MRLQGERKQTVVDTGPYSVIRHPMYAGAPLVLLGLTLWLESYVAAIASIIPIVLLMLRIVLEERFLGRELEGYGEYARSVRYRLVPGVW